MLISQSQKDKYCMIPLIGGTWSHWIHRDGSRMVVAGVGRAGTGELVCNGYRATVWEDEKSSGGDGYTIV